MSKILNLKERVHQPFRDCLIRTFGTFQSTVQRASDLFLQTGRDEGLSNLKSGAQLPNDSSFVMLAARVFCNFRQLRNRQDPIVGDAGFQGDIQATAAAGALMLAAGNGLAHSPDIYRLYSQTAEQLFWTIGSGEKDSLRSVPTWYLPAGGGIVGTWEGSDAIHYSNGKESHEAILRIARAITITPRQLIRVSVNGVPMPTGGNAAVFVSTAANGRDYANVIDNLNAMDLIAKSVVCCIDGLLARDVQ